MGVINLFTKAVVIAAAFDWILGGLFRTGLGEHLNHGSMVGFVLQWAVAGAIVWQLAQIIGVIAESAVDREG